MITDKISNYKLYTGLGSNFKEAFELLASNRFNRESGRYELSNGMYYMVQSYETKPVSDGMFESHRKYIDLQFIVDGKERQDYLNLAALKIREPYNADKDVIIYDVPDSKGFALILETGYFAIYYPEDGHMPNLRTGSNADKNIKVVVKIPVT